MQLNTGYKAADVDIGIKSIIMKKKSWTSILFYSPWLSGSFDLFFSLLTLIQLLHPLVSSLLPYSTKTSISAKFTSTWISAFLKLLAVSNPFLLSK